MNPIGFSTGALALGDFRLALGYLHGTDFSVVELSALRTAELPVLLRDISSCDLSQFRYIALHAPSAFSAAEEPEIVRFLREAPAQWRIILHPDTIHDYRRWVPFGSQLVIENMDRRKPDGRSAQELLRWFERLPQAQFCLDLAHAQQWDTTMTEAYLLLKTFSRRLCQIHISQLDSASHHYPLSTGSVRAFSEVSWLIPQGVPLIIESRISPTEMVSEAEKVQRITNWTPSDAYQTIPV
jgi:Xylose isomerase-like TIM barrel